MKKYLIDYYPYYKTAEDENENLIVKIYPTYEDMESNTNATTYNYTLSLSASVLDSECCRVKIDNDFYYFGG